MTAVATEVGKTAAEGLGVGISISPKSGVGGCVTQPPARSATIKQIRANRIRMAYPLTAPTVNPSMKYRCAAKNRTRIGAAITVDMAIM